MNTPFTTEQFFDVFKKYNLTVFPMQIVLFSLAVMAIYLVFKPMKHSDKIVNILLAMLWLWMGFIYHFMFFSEINRASYLFGTLFILQGVLFVYPGFFQNHLKFKYTGDKSNFAAIIILIYALLVYPVLGYFSDHRYPFSPTFGLPCPTTMFTFGMLLLSKGRISLIFLIIPVLWSLIGSFAIVNFNVWEDAGLIVSGLVATFLLVNRNRVLSRSIYKTEKI